jgi:hypothetical protein
MAGIANVIPTADFSNSPLGRVTIVQTPAERAAEIVSDYTTAIGDSTYSTELLTMVTSLITLGAWDNLDIYPMLGNTVEKLSKNLNADNGFIKAPIALKENSATVGSDNKHIVVSKIADNNEDALPSELETKDKTIASASDISGIYSFLDFKRADSSAMSLIYHKRIANTYIGTRLRCAAGSSGGQLYFNLGKTSVSSPDYSIAYNNTLVGQRHRIEVLANGTTLGLYVDEQLDTNASDEPTSIATYEFTDKTYVRNNALCNHATGECRFYAQGDIDPLLFASVNTIFKTFLDAVKPNLSSNEINQ